MGEILGADFECELSLLIYKVFFKDECAAGIYVLKLNEVKMNYRSCKGDATAGTPIVSTAIWRVRFHMPQS